MTFRFSGSRNAAERQLTNIIFIYCGLKGDEIVDLDVLMGMLYMLEPNDYDADFKAY